MTETPTTSADDLDPIIQVLTELMRTATRPDVLEAQRVLLQRLAYQGDVFPSRVPPPLNITEVGGYLNLLASMGMTETRANAVASALGIAGPPPGARTGTPATGFVDMVNDRPPGPAQHTVPPTVRVRADLVTALQTALSVLHASGCSLPLRAPVPQQVLPPSGPGTGPVAAPDPDLLLAILGRSLEIFPGTVLVDPATDPLALARPDESPAPPLRLVARELDGGAAVPEAPWRAVRADATSATEDPVAAARYLEVAPVLEAQGWYHPQPLAAPTSLTDRGTLVRLVNRTSLVAGETTLGSELEQLYSAAEIGRSALAGQVHAVWDGERFS